MASKKGKKAAKAPVLVGVSTRIPAGLWTRVKTYCAKGNLTVQEFIIGLLTKATKK